MYKLSYFNHNISSSFISANAKRTQEGVVGKSKVIFTEQVPTPWNGPPTVKLRKILDLVMKCFLLILCFKQSELFEYTCNND